MAKIIHLKKHHKCDCGRKLLHHHFLCDSCWNLQRKTINIHKKAEKQNIDLNKPQGGKK